MNIIGVVSGGLGIIQFGMDNFAPKDEVGSTIRIGVGLDYAGGLNNAGGNLPDVRLFNEAGGFLGITADPGDVNDGGYGEVKINHKTDSTQQATYALFSANDNAICIAYATITWPDDGKYAWTGDTGAGCGHSSWYHSNIYINGAGKSTSPACTWIDANGDLPETGFQVHWPEFVRDSDVTPTDIDQNYICNSGPPFTMFTSPDPNTITYWILTKEKVKRAIGALVPARKTTKFKSRIVRRQTYGNGTHANLHANRLIISDSDQHSVTKLCESVTSLGPDFVNTLDGQFCRMSDKSLWPVCTAEITDNCFNLDLQQMVIGGLTTRDSPYVDIGDWTRHGSFKAKMKRDGKYMTIGDWSHGHGSKA
jgi:hypothetical protein